MQRRRSSASTSRNSFDQSAPTPPGSLSPSSSVTSISTSAHHHSSRSDHSQHHHSHPPSLPRSTSIKDVLIVFNTVNLTSKLSTRIIFDPVNTTTRMIYDEIAKAFQFSGIIYYLILYIIPYRQIYFLDDLDSILLLMPLSLQIIDQEMSIYGVFIPPKNIDGIASEGLWLDNSVDQTMGSYKLFGEVCSSSFCLSMDHSEIHFYVQY